MLPVKANRLDRTQSTFSPLPRPRVTRLSRFGMEARPITIMIPDQSNPSITRNPSSQVRTLVGLQPQWIKTPRPPISPVGYYHPTYRSESVNSVADSELRLMSILINSQDHVSPTPAGITASHEASNSSDSESPLRVWTKAVSSTVSSGAGKFPFLGHQIKSVRTLGQELRDSPINSFPDQYDFSEEPFACPFSIFHHIYRSGVQTEVKVVFGIMKEWKGQEAMWLGLLISVENITAAGLYAAVDLHPYGDPARSTEGKAKPSAQPVVLHVETRKAVGPTTPVEKASEKGGKLNVAGPDPASGTGGECDYKRTSSWTTVEETTNEVWKKADRKDCNVKTGGRLRATEDAKEKKGVDKRIPVLLIIDPKDRPFVVLTARVNAIQRWRRKIFKHLRIKPTGDASAAKLPCKTFGRNRNWAAMSHDELFSEIVNC